MKKAPETFVVASLLRREGDGDFHTPCRKSLSRNPVTHGVPPRGGFRAPAQHREAIL